MESVVVDVSGGQVGGVARIRGECERYLELKQPQEVRVIGSSHYQTASWLVRREFMTRGASRRIGLFNTAFLAPGGTRVAVAQNAFHYLTEAEKGKYRGIVPWSVIHAQAMVVQQSARMCDMLIAPCTDMAERIIRVVPSVRNRVVVRFNPISADSIPSGFDREPAILCPIILWPYKKMDERLARLVQALDDYGDPDIEVRITAAPEELPPFLAEHRRVVPLGRLEFSDLRQIWARSQAIYFPTDIESFGYPLAEARLSGRPVIGIDYPQNHEIAGAALCPYTEGDVDSLRGAIAKAFTAVVQPDPLPFDPVSYFDFLLGREAPS